MSIAHTEKHENAVVKDMGPKTEMVQKCFDSQRFRGKTKLLNRTLDNAVHQ